MDILDQVIFVLLCFSLFGVRWCHAVHCRMVGNIPGLYSLDAHCIPSPPVVTTSTVSDIAKCPLGDKSRFVGQGES